MPPPVVSSLTPRYQQKREGVLHRAAQLFNQYGLKGATLATIAESVGLATNSITYYYRKKEDLAKACLLRSIEASDAVIREAAEHDTVQARVHAYFQGHARLLAAIALGQHPPLMYFRDVRALPEPQATEVFAAYNAMFRRVRALLSEARAPQTHRQLNARTYLVLAAANWMAPWLEERYEPDEFERVAACISDLLLHGMSRNCTALAPITDWRPPPADDAKAEAFLRMAIILVNEQGYRGASIEKIAGRLNLTKGAFYHHNDNKQDLISACFERTFAVVRQALKLAQQAEGAGRDRAFSAALMLVQYQVSSNGPLLRFSALSALPDPNERQQAVRVLYQLTERMTALLAEGMVDGSVRATDPGIAARVIIAAVMGAAALGNWASGVDADNAAELYVRPLFEGILRGPEVDRRADPIAGMVASTSATG